MQTPQIGDRNRGLCNETGLEAATQALGRLMCYSSVAGTSPPTRKAVREDGSWIRRGPRNDFFSQPVQLGSGGLTR